MLFWRVLLSSAGILVECRFGGALTGQEALTKSAHQERSPKTLSIDALQKRSPISVFAIIAKSALTLESAFAERF